MISFKKGDIHKRKYITNTTRAHFLGLAEPQPRVRCIEKSGPINANVLVYGGGEIVTKFTYPITSFNQTRQPEAVEDFISLVLRGFEKSLKDEQNVVTKLTKKQHSSLVNPFKKPNSLDGRDYSKSDLVYIYDGEFQKVPLPFEGRAFHNAYLRSVVVDFFSALSSNVSKRECYPTGSVQVPWTLKTYKEDAFGNKLAVSEKTLYATMAPEVVPTFRTELNENLYSSRGVGSAVLGLVRALGCGSAEYQHLYSQILSLNDGLLNGFDIDNNGGIGNLKFSRKARLDFVNLCLSREYEPTEPAFMDCTCRAFVLDKYYEKVGDYVRRGGSPYGFTLPEDVKEVAAEEYLLQCRDGNRLIRSQDRFQPGVSELISDLRPDVH